MNKDLSALKKLVDANFDSALSYDAYVELIEKLHAENRITGDNQSEKLLEYSKLNEHRMKRIYRKQVLDEDLIAKIKSLKGRYTWLVITESWCPDGAQNLPIMEKLSHHSENVSTKYILRDENPEIMNLFLTNGSKSIPIIVCLNHIGEVQFQWGPRPLPVQERVMEYKHAPEPKVSYDEFAKGNQLWYAKNKGSRFQEELKLLLDLID